MPGDLTMPSFTIVDEPSLEVSRRNDGTPRCVLQSATDSWGNMLITCGRCSKLILCVPSGGKRCTTWPASTEKEARISVAYSSLFLDFDFQCQETTSSLLMSMSIRLG